MSTPSDELRKIEVEVHKAFPDSAPTKGELTTYLKTRTAPKMDGGASVLLLLILKYGPVASLLLSTWTAVRTGKRPPRCPRKGCGMRQVTVDSKGRSVCGNGHKWRPA